MKIAIIGAGPASSHLSTKLLKLNSKLTIDIFEKQGEKQKQIACTGLLTKEITKYLEKPIKKYTFFKNKINSATIYYDSKSDKSALTLPLIEYVIDRRLFDETLAKIAEKNGAKIFYNHKLTGIKSKNKKYYIECLNKLKKTYKGPYDILIAADGAHSDTRKILYEKGILSSKKINKVKYLVGHQYIITTNKNITNEHEFECFFSEDHKQFFSWIVPENKRNIRVGTGTLKFSKKQLKKILDTYTKEKNIKYKIKETQAGLIPIYNHFLKINDLFHTRKNIFFCGDANFNLKNTTGGGIIPGFINAGNIAKYIVEKNNKIEHKNNINTKNLFPGLNFIKNETKLMFQLGIHKIINDKLSKLKTKRFHTLIKLMNQEKVKNILTSISRDKIISLSFRLIITEPRLLQFLF